MTGNEPSTFWWIDRAPSHDRNDGTTNGPTKFWWIDQPPPPPRRIRWPLVAVLVAATLLEGLAVGRPPLDPVDGGSTTGVYGRRVGQHVIFGGPVIRPRGSRPVRVRSVRLTGLPRGLRVVGIWGREGGPAIGAADGDPEPYLREQLRPVTDMVSDPDDPAHDWGLLVVLTAVEPGHWATTGIDVVWSAGWRQGGVTHFENRFEVDAIP